MQNIPQVPSGNAPAGKAELVLLGTKVGPALRHPGVSFLPTASHLSLPGRSIIIDCGLGVTASMVASGHALDDLTDVFITHHHSDHVLELGGLCIQHGLLAFHIR